MTPTIDVHTHIFNAIDIPIEGYLRSRRSERRRLRNIEYFSGFLPGPHLLTYVAERMRERCISRKLGIGDKGKIYSFLLWAFGVVMHQRLKVWEESLSNDVEQTAADLLKTWDGVDLFVPLMIDYEYWFSNTIDTDIKDQVERIHDNVIIPHEGRIHPFAPFCPARELAYRNELNNPDGQRETTSSLALVKDAIENKGFVGVKVYNTLGYTPFNNKNVETQRKLIAVRNGKLRYICEGEEYDAVLSELYDYCIENEVPITAHCQIGGIEAYPEASSDFAEPGLWEDVLKQERYKGLRVNLGHFGWNQAVNHGYYAEKSWVKRICGMMIEYPGLYADVSHHRVTTTTYRAKFESAYKSMRNRFSEDIHEIKKKLLYGSDWHVLRRVKNYKEFMDRYIDVLVNGGLFSEEEIGDFLGGNALDFLGLRPGGMNRERLVAFYSKHNIDPPDWFVSTAEPSATSS